MGNSVSMRLEVKIKQRSKNNLTTRPLNFTNNFFIEDKTSTEEYLMKCHRCGSVMVSEIFHGPDEPFLGWRCIQFGEIIDHVILENRQAGVGRHK